MAANSDLSCLSKIQANVVEKVLEELNMKGKELSMEPLGKVGDNYAADVRVIKVKFEDNTEYRIIVKLSSTSGENAMSELIRILFNNEITMYKEVLPTLSQLQENAGVELKNAFQFATCYGFSTENQKEILLLEDLSKYNYVILDKYKPLSDETIKLVLGNLADYHSLSYALKSKDPDTFNEFSKKLIDINIVMGNDTTQLKGFMAMGESFSQIFDKIKYKNIVRSLFSIQQMEKANKIREMDLGSKYSVILHGDTWTNNILFQSENEKPSKCIFIDYQIVREGLPVLDILYLIFNCTDYESRSKHYYEWIDFYHAHLEKSLGNFGLRINNVYPKDKLESDMMRYAKIALTSAVMALSILLRKSEESAAFKDALSESKEIDSILNQMQIHKLETDSVANIKERIEGLIDSCFEFGLLSAL